MGMEFCKIILSSSLYYNHSPPRPRPHRPTPSTHTHTHHLVPHIKQEFQGFLGFFSLCMTFPPGNGRDKMSLKELNTICSIEILTYFFLFLIAHLNICLLNLGQKMRREKHSRCKESSASSEYMQRGFFTNCFFSLDSES